MRLRPSPAVELSQEEGQQQGAGGSSHSTKAAGGEKQAEEEAVGTGPLLAQFSALDHSVHPGR